MILQKLLIKFYTHKESAMKNILYKIRNRISGLIKQLASREGFSLIEIMIVVTIIATLIGLVSRTIFKKPHEARVQAAKVKIQQLALPLLDFSNQDGNYPGTEEGLESLVTEGLAKKKDIIDPWGNPYGYRYPGEFDGNDFEIWSYGADGAEGGEGVNADIKSWE